MRLSLLTAVAPLVLLAACASTRGGVRGDAANDPVGGSSPYGMFLAGQLAMSSGKSGDAARFFDRARAGAADEILIAEKAFGAALLSGDIPRAASLAPTGEDASESARRLGRLVVAVEAMAQGKGKDAAARLNAEAMAFPHKPAAALLAPWAAAMAGDVEGSLVRPQVLGDRQVDYFGQLGQAALFERARRFDEAETDFKAMAGVTGPAEMAVVAYGGFLERRGRRIDAVALYQSYLAGEPASLAVKAAVARASAGRPAPAMPGLREGAGQALLATAAGMMAAKQETLALAYLRLVIRLDPQRDEAWVMVGDLMQGNNDIEAARAAYAHPRPGSLEYGAAQAKLAWTYQSSGDKETALKLARAGAAAGGADARVNLADILRANERFAEAVEVLSGLIAEDKAPDWRLIYARGQAYERINRWADAQADLQTALKAHPDEPELLNYLGYSWIDRGERLPEALAMVQKAVAANPRSGAMVDSLGWAFYRLGDYRQAVEKLEEAVELEAGDPEINNHLGDAYWKVGRKDEAQFQWRRVLTLKPDDKIRAKAEAKLASGLGPDGPAPKVADKAP